MHNGWTRLVSLVICVMAALTILPFTLALVPTATKPEEVGMSSE
jgi:hypothetical protein